LNSNDPRITRVGRIIRNTGIDALPQLINIIKGDMSIVGNDPLSLYEAEQFMNGENAKRFLAPAGIISLWQVEERRSGPALSEKERIRIENAYADQFTEGKYSIWFDMSLIIKRIRM
jgi:lipopolysaccharide/colanic/teichoic acid biosynthesis glycosyltransferase